MIDHPQFTYDKQTFLNDVCSFREKNALLFTRKSRASAFEVGTLLNRNKYGGIIVSKVVSFECGDSWKNTWAERAGVGVEDHMHKT